MVREANRQYYKQLASLFNTVKCFNTINGLTNFLDDLRDQRIEKNWMMLVNGKIGKEIIPNI